MHPGCAATIEGARRYSGEEGARLYEDLLRRATFADTRPLFGDAFVDHDGRLWVSELPWPSRYEPPGPWSVFSPDGRWLGDVEPPARAWLQDARGDRVLAVWRDELDVAYLRVYRLVAG